MKTKKQIILIAAILCTGCSVAHLQNSDYPENYPPTVAENLEVYSTEDAHRPYVVIGEVIASVDALGDGSASVRYLKKEAANLGADAIVNLRLEIGEGALGNSVTASGTAVKFDY